MVHATGSTERCVKWIPHLPTRPWLARPILVFHAPLVQEQETNSKDYWGGSSPSHGMIPSQQAMALTTS